MSAADTLLAALLRSQQGHRPTPVTDEFARAVAGKLQERGYEMPGLPVEERHWWDRALDSAQAQEQAKRSREEKAEAEAAKPRQSTAALLAAEIAKASPQQHIPLNGAAVLRAALAGGSGTINSEPVSGRMDYAG